jgi:NAD(P)H-flavin reductase/hemoglobin-like flavoprotein
MVDAARLKDSWAVVGAAGDQVPLFFYSTLFLMHPETRNMFPVGMANQRDKLVGALGHVVSNVDRVDELVPFLQQLGTDHRKFAVTADHYPAVGKALLATLGHFLGAQWTPELAAEWEGAFGLVAKVMNDAAEEAAQHSPPWWEAEVISHERRSLDIAVLTIKPNYALDYLPGQSVAVETAVQPRLWRFYSPANAPRPEGTIDLHVRMVPGGPVSSALVQATGVGDVLRLGAPVGHRLTLNESTGGDVVLLAGGTGLAPLKAIVEQLANEGGQRRAFLFLGARMGRDLYDLDTLSKFAVRNPWLTVVPAISDDPLHRGEQSLVVEAALRSGLRSEHEVFVCGSQDMVVGTLERLDQAGISTDRIHVEDFSSGQYQTAALAASAHGGM